jgi:3-oxoacyl-[acyl-carrier-protein] synthase II
MAGGLCEVKNFKPEDYLDRRDARRRDRYQQLAAVAAKEALAQAQLPITDDNRERIGVILGTGVGGIQTLVDQEHTRQEKGLRRISPFAITMIMPNGASGMLAIDYGIQGPSTTITTACAAGCDAVGHAFRALRRGELDACLTGGSESILASVAIGGFERAGATSPRSENAPQPFDKNRDGLVVGEGAGMLVLETLDHALARGATILAELVGYGQTTDAYHITAPAEGGAGAARAITIALQDAGLSPEDVDYISAHGTATPLNDASETAAVKAALGDHAYKVAISSTKSMTGHVMGPPAPLRASFAPWPSATRFCRPPSITKHPIRTAIWIMCPTRPGRPRCVSASTTPLALVATTPFWSLRSMKDESVKDNPSKCLICQSVVKK